MSSLDSLLTLTLVTDTPDKELGTIGLVEKLGTLDDNGIQLGEGNVSQAGQDGQAGKEASHD